jgi:plastocyanin
MRRTLVALTLLAAAGVLAAGCGGNNAGSGGYGAGGGSSATTEAPSATDSGGRGGYGGGPTTSGAGTPATGTAVAIDNFAFSPATLNAKMDQKVTWTNKQGVAHTVTANAGAFNHPMPSGGDVLVHLHQGGHLRVPLHDPPVDAGDDRGVVATSG